MDADEVVKAKVFFSAAFFYISSLKDENTGYNTAATIQPNPFWFWENLYVCISIVPYIELSMYRGWQEVAEKPP